MEVPNRCFPQAPTDHSLLGNDWQYIFSIVCISFYITILASEQFTLSFAWNTYSPMGCNCNGIDLVNVYLTDFFLIILWVSEESLGPWATNRWATGGKHTIWCDKIQQPMLVQTLGVGTEVSGLGKPRMLCNRVVTLRKEIQNLFSTQKSGVNVHSSFLTFPCGQRLSCTRPFSQTYFSQPISRTYPYGRYQMYFVKSFNVVTSDLYSAFFAQGDLGLLCCTWGIELIITKIVFIGLWCLNMPK